MIRKRLRLFTNDTWHVCAVFAPQIVLGLRFETAEVVTSFDLFLPFVTFEFQFAHAEAKGSYCICKYDIVTNHPECPAHKSKDILTHTT